MGHFGEGGTLGFNGSKSQRTRERVSLYSILVMCVCVCVQKNFQPPTVHCLVLYVHPIRSKFVCTKVPGSATGALAQTPRVWVSSTANFNSHYFLFFWTFLRGTHHITWYVWRLHDVCASQSISLAHFAWTQMQYDCQIMQKTAHANRSVSCRCSVFCYLSWWAVYSAHFNDCPTKYACIACEHSNISHIESTQI